MIKREIFLASLELPKNVICLGNAPFMRGLLFNAGYKESLEHLSFKPDCIILHDVDHLPGTFNK